MADDTPKPSQVDAQPDAGSTKPEAPKPGEAPKHAETEAQPDRPVPNKPADR